MVCCGTVRRALRQFRTLPVLLTGWAALGCAGHYDTKRSPDTVRKIPMPARFVESPRQAARGAFGKQAWWSTLGNRELDRHVTTALAGNLGLRETASRITAAEASLRQAGARLFPSLDASGDTSRRWDDTRSGTSDTSGASLGALLDWEADIFGRVRAARRASAAELEATRADLAGARLLLITALAET